MDPSNSARPELRKDPYGSSVNLLSERTGERVRMRLPFPPPAPTAEEMTARPVPVSTGAGPRRLLPLQYLPLAGQSFLTPQTFSHRTTAGTNPQALQAMAYFPSGNDPNYFGVPISQILGDGTEGSPSEFFPIGVDFFSQIFSPPSPTMSHTPTWDHDRAGCVLGEVSNQQPDSAGAEADGYHLVHCPKPHAAYDIVNTDATQSTHVEFDHIMSSTDSTMTGASEFGGLSTEQNTGVERFDQELEDLALTATPFQHQLQKVQTSTVMAMVPVDRKASYATLIYCALRSKPGHSMVLREIYDWFELNTEKNANPKDKGWQNSIRHNLSMNEGFVKCDPYPSSDGGKSANVWVLSEDALKAGKVEPTTRYRKATRASVPRRAIGTPPSNRRSGTKGGRHAPARNRGMVRRTIDRKEAGSRSIASRTPSTRPVTESPEVGHQIMQQPMTMNMSQPEHQAARQFERATTPPPVRTTFPMPMRFANMGGNGDHVGMTQHGLTFGGSSSSSPTNCYMPPTPHSFSSPPVMHFNPGHSHGMHDTRAGNFQDTPAVAEPIQLYGTDGASDELRESYDCLSDYDKFFGAPGGYGIGSG